MVITFSGWAAEVPRTPVSESHNKQPCRRTTGAVATTTTTITQRRGMRNQRWLKMETFQKWMCPHSRIQTPDSVINEMTCIWNYLCLHQQKGIDERLSLFGVWHRGKVYRYYIRAPVNLENKDPNQTQAWQWGQMDDLHHSELMNCLHTTVIHYATWRIIISWRA